MKKSKQKLDTILNKTFKFAKKTAKNFYFNTWAKNPPQCQALDNQIIAITREGWEHIIDDTSRTKTDVLGRLFVLERAKKLLEKTTTFSQKHTKNDKEYWVFDGVVKNIALRVVIRSIKKSPLHFLTVIKKGTVENKIKTNA
ncbi:hypothetical protein CL633_02720 [bacterium]|nr:hypothetical protein [bacterium]|tara:strand:+ start:30 stop:455 length:426 start_codon:yes stop_codon:yes gene_type:complete